MGQKVQKPSQFVCLSAGLGRKESLPSQPIPVDSADPETACRSGPDQEKERDHVLQPKPETESHPELEQDQNEDQELEPGAGTESHPEPEQDQNEDQELEPGAGTKRSP